MASPALVALLNAAGGSTPVLQRDIFTLTLQDGTVLYYADADFPITADDATIWNPPSIIDGRGMWQSDLLWLPSLMESGEGQTASWKLGLNSNTWQLSFWPRSVDPITGETYPDKIGSVPWIQAARQGYLEQADVIVTTAYFSSIPAYPPRSGVSPVGTLTTFRGMIGQVDCGDGAVFMSVVDYRYLLSQMMPRNEYQSSCRHRLYDERCTLARATFSKTGSVLSATGSQVVAAAPLAAPGGSNTYKLGLLTVTSGLNAGFSRSVVDWDGASTFALLNPFPFPLAMGDTFTISAGCDKSLATCNLFANKANFGGNPYIPIPEVQIG